MRIPVPLGWTILALTFFTAGLLRPFHDRIPTSPVVHPIVGSALFAAIFLLLLVAAREWRRGPVPGPGVRLGSLLPIVLVLLIEKWFSLMVYPPVFDAWTAAAGDPKMLDARFRAMAGLGLLLVCLLVAPLSRPTMRKTWRRGRPARWPVAALGGLAVIACAYAFLGGLSALLGGSMRLEFPRSEPLVGWTVGGQFLLGFAEELYYRGLVLCELERLVPRLGIRRPTPRRWAALLGSALLFGFEHLSLGPPWTVVLREMTFSVCLGLLFGLLVMVTLNLHFAAAVHAWINWLLLGVAPRFVDVAGNPALPAGTYIGITLVLSFVAAFAYQRWRHWRRRDEPGQALEL